MAVWRVLLPTKLSSADQLCLRTSRLCKSASASSATEQNGSGDKSSWALQVVSAR